MLLFWFIDDVNYVSTDRLQLSLTVVVVLLMLSKTNTVPAW